jgi:hypothetical protein
VTREELDTACDVLEEGMQRTPYGDVIHTKLLRLIASKLLSNPISSSSALVTSVAGGVEKVVPR